MNGPRGNGETREAILDATDRLLTTRGFRSVTMDDIAGEAGVSRRTIYMYFPSKEEVGLSSIDRVVAQTFARLEALASAGGDPAEVLRAVLIERVLRRLDSVSAYRQSLDELFEAVRPAYMARRTAHMAREVALVAAVLAAGAACGRFSLDDEATATASTLVKATNAFLPYSLSVAELGERAKVEVEVRRMADLLLKSVVARARAAAGVSVRRGAAARGGATTMPAGKRAAGAKTRSAEQPAGETTRPAEKRAAGAMTKATEGRAAGATTRPAEKRAAGAMTKASEGRAAGATTRPAEKRAAGAKTRPAEQPAGATRRPAAERTAEERSVTTRRRRATARGRRRRAG